MQAFHPLLRDSELYLLFMVPEVKEVNLLDFNVQVAEPLVDVAHVTLLNVFKLVHIPVDLSIEHRQFELALTHFEITVNYGEGSPSVDQVLAGVLAGQVNEFEDKNVGWDEGLGRRQHEVELMAVEVDGVLQHGVMPNNVTINLSKV